MASLDRRVYLFKRNLRQIIGAPWLRFEWSVGRTALIVNLFRFYREDRAGVIRRLRSAGIEFQEMRMCESWPPTYLSIPIDQEALPEGGRKRREEVCEAC